MDLFHVLQIKKCNRISIKKESTLWVQLASNEPLAIVHSAHMVLTIIKL